MKLFSFCAGEEAGIGVETQEGPLNLTEALNIYQQAKGIKNAVSFSFLQVLVEMGYCRGEVIRQVLSDSWVNAKITDLRLSPELKFELPIMRPSKIIAMGRNYMAHAKELKHDLPEEPLFFCKSPSSLIPHEGEIYIPSWLNSRVDHEAELALVLGKQGKNIPEEGAMEYIAGYTILNDVTARSMQKEDLRKGNPWFRSKSIDTFCPLGPYLIPVDEIEDPHNLDIKLMVNGQTKQKSNTSFMIFKIPAIISYVSKYMTLQPGDIIATGTPEGVSPIKNEDVIEITISEIGTLKNNVVTEETIKK